MRVGDIVQSGVVKLASSNFVLTEAEGQGVFQHLIQDADYTLYGLANAVTRFGSSGKGKPCKNMRMLYILRSGDAIPLLLSLPPTSIRPFKNFVNMAFALRRRPIYGSLVKITLKPVSNNGNEYSVASFTKVRDFAGEELAGIVAYAENFRKMVKETLEQRALEQKAVSAVVPPATGPVELPDNDAHFSVGLLDGGCLRKIDCAAAGHDMASLAIGRCWSG